MEIIIHDLPEEKLKNMYKSTDNSLIISDNKKIRNCMGVFIVGLKTQVNVE